MNYKKTFTNMINESSNILKGAVKVYNYVADRRYFDHMEVIYMHEENRYLMGCPAVEVKGVEDLCKELEYWLSCYYESGNCRHDDEFSDRIMIIRALEVLINYCDDYKVTSVPRNKDTEGLF